MRRRKCTGEGDSRGRRWAPWLVAVVIVALLGVCGAAGASGISSAAGPSSRVSITVAGSEVGQPIAPGFLGLGLEFRSVPAYIGSDPSRPNTVFVQLVKDLTDNQPPVLRIGGESTDRTWWPIPRETPPLGVTESITPGWITSARTLADTTGARLIVGVNLEANRSSITQSEAQALVTGIGRARIAALELGNEPELYAVVPWYVDDNGVALPWYRRGHGTAVLARRPGYDFAIFAGEFSRFRKVLPNVPLDAPSTGNVRWLTQLPPFLATQSPLNSVTFHRYGLNGCVIDPFSPSYPTIPNLLSTFASRGIMNGIGKYVALAHSRRMGFRIDEMNSVTCGGRVGVSNTFASALWVLDALFDMASDGVDGVNIHTFQDSNSGLFDFRRLHGQWVGMVHPEYYGMLMFAQAAPPGSRLLPVSLLPVSPPADVRVWATRTPQGQTHVVLINDSLTSTNTVTLRASGVAGAARLERLQAASISATDGVTIAGQSFGTPTTTGLVTAPSQTTTGELTGTPSLSPVRARGGAYSVQLPAASAAMLTWTGR